MKDAALIEAARALKAFALTPSGTEGYAKAEVTVGGIDTNALSQQTMEARAVPGLFFIGEAVDVTGWLGGYNFQWAWSSGWAAGSILLSVEARVRQIAMGNGRNRAPCGIVLAITVVLKQHARAAA